MFIEHSRKTPVEKEESLGRTHNMIASYFGDEKNARRFRADLVPKIRDNAIKFSESLKALGYGDNMSSQVRTALSIWIATEHAHQNDGLRKVPMLYFVNYYHIEGGGTVNGQLFNIKAFLGKSGHPELQHIRASELFDAVIKLAEEISSKQSKIADVSESEPKVSSIVEDSIVIKNNVRS